MMRETERKAREEAERMAELAAAAEREKAKQIAAVARKEAEDLANRGMEGTRAGEERTFGGITFCWCPAGTFQMGSPKAEEERISEEALHEVTLTRGFWLAKYECTQTEWRAVIGSDPSEIKGDRLPVESVSWGDAQRYVAMLNEKVGLGRGWEFALPTEAQWEYGCRAGTRTPFSFGVECNGFNANCNGKAPYGTRYEGTWLEKTKVVGSYAPNPWGLCDMHGNVEEWCADWYRYGKEHIRDGQLDPTGPSDGMHRLTRGGAWDDWAENCRSAERQRMAPDTRLGFIGFRLAVFDPVGTKREAERLTREEVARAERIAQMEAEALASHGMEGVKAGEERTFGGIDFCWCPAGSFQMGSPETEAKRDYDETLHEVTLTSGYWLAKYECTQAQWLSVMEGNPSEFPGDGLPVDKVSWKAAQLYIAGLNAKGVLTSGWRFALPTEAQWEYGCRAGTRTPFSFGARLMGKEANFDGYHGKTIQTGSFAPNPWGLCDMHGNVEEWCSDVYSRDYYRKGENRHRDPVGHAHGTTRVIRGGNWKTDAEYCRSAARTRASFDSKYQGGFRLAVIDAESMAREAERMAREEAERMAREAERKAREKAERMAREESARKTKGRQVGEFGKMIIGNFTWIVTLADGRIVTGYTTFLGDGTFTSTRLRWGGTWRFLEVSVDGRLAVEMKIPSRARAKLPTITLRFDSQAKSFTGTAFNGRPVKGNRILKD